MIWPGLIIISSKISMQAILFFPFLFAYSSDFKGRILFKWIIKKIPSYITASLKVMYDSLTCCNSMPSTTTIEEKNKMRGPLIPAGNKLLLLFLSQKDWKFLVRLHFCPTLSELMVRDRTCKMSTKKWVNDEGKRQWQRILPKPTRVPYLKSSFREFD